MTVELWSNNIAIDDGVSIPTQPLPVNWIFKETIRENIRPWPNGFRKHGWLFSRKKTFLKWTIDVLKLKLLQQLDAKNLLR